MKTDAESPAAPPRITELFLAFLGVGISGFGGVLPFARRMLVEQRRWMSAAEFTETLMLCQTLPGPNIVNVSVAVGSRFAGARGAAAAFLGLMGAPVAIVLALAVLYDRFGQVGRAPQLLLGLGAAAAGLVAATAGKLGWPLVTTRSLQGVLVAALIFVGVGLLRWPLPAVLGGVAPLSLFLAWRSRG